jgi:predicted DNA-binding protein (MmcQ/YjbR family)
MNYDSLCAYLEAKPAVRRDMPFGPDVLVFKVLNKMFALVAWQADPITLSIKASPMDVIILQQQFTAVKPGYHLNKKHWITVTLDGSMPDDELKAIIDESYALVIGKISQSDRSKIQLQKKDENG